MTQTDLGRANSRQEEDKSLSQFLPTKMVDSGKFCGIYTLIKDTDNIIIIVHLDSIKYVNIFLVFLDNF